MPFNNNGRVLVRSSEGDEEEEEKRTGSRAVAPNFVNQKKGKKRATAFLCVPTGPVKATFLLCTRYKRKCKPNIKKS